MKERKKKKRQAKLQKRKAIKKENETRKLLLKSF
jgi:hypothetical protein